MKSHIEDGVGEPLRPQGLFELCQKHFVHPVPFQINQNITTTHRYFRYPVEVKSVEGQGGGG